MKDFRLFTRWSEDVVYICLTTIFLFPFNFNPIAGSILTWGISMLLARELRHAFNGEVPEDNITAFSLLITWSIFSIVYFFSEKTWSFLILPLYSYIGWFLAVLIAKYLFPPKD